MAFKYNPLSGQIEDQQQGPQGPAGTVSDTVAGGDESEPGFRFQGDSDTGIYSSGINSLGIATGGAGRLFIGSSGNVGIGVLSATSTLHVRDTDPVIHIERQYASTSALVGKITFGNSNWDSDLASIRAYHDGSNTAAGFDFYTQAAGNVSVPRLRVSSNGKVGVGTTSPKANLHIKSSSNAWSQGLLLEDSTGNDGWNFYPDPDSGGELFIGYNDDLSGDPEGASTVFKLKASDKTAYFYGDAEFSGQLRATGASDVKLTLGSAGTVNTNDSVHVRADGANLKFMAASGGGTYFEHNGQATITIPPSGNVGIGTTSPAEKLDVTGTISVTGGLKVASHPVVGYASTLSSYATRLGSTGTSTLRYTQIYGGGNLIATCDGTNGNVGIGTDSPSKKLVVVSPAHDNGVEILAGGNGQSTNLLLQGKSTGGTEYNYTIGSARSGYFGISDGTSTRFAIKDGKVGIGTTSPDTLLHISQGNVGAPQNAGSGLMIEHSTSADLQFMSGGGGYNHIFFGDADDANIGLIRYNHAGNANSMDFITNASSTPNLKIASSGKVSIGEATAHSYNAHVAVDDFVVGGSSSHGITVLTGNTSTGSLWFDAQDATRGYIQYAHNEQSLILGTEGNERLRINSSGFVGIGSNSPNRLLHIAGSGTANLIRVGRTDSSSHGSHDVQVQFAENHYHNLNVGAETYSLSTRSTANALVINNDGKVGIGTTSPNAILQINQAGAVQTIIGSTNGGGAWLILDGDSNGDGLGSDYSSIVHNSDGLVLTNRKTTPIIFKNMIGGSETEALRISDGDTKLPDDKYLKFGTENDLTIRHASGNNWINSQNGSLYIQAGGSNAVEVKDNGDVAINDGDLVIGTSGHGIRANGPDNATYGELKVQVDVPDSSGTNNEATFKKAASGIVLAFPDGGGVNFGATSSGSSTSSTLDDYEEGNHNPTDVSGASLSFTNNNTGIYTKIGGFVHFSFDITFPSTSNGSDAQLSAPYMADQDNHGGGFVGFTNVGTAVLLHINTGGVFLRDEGGSNLTNTQCSGKRFIGQVIFRAP